MVCIRFNDAHEMIIPAVSTIYIARAQSDLPIKKESRLQRHGMPRIRRVPAVMEAVMLPNTGAEVDGR